MSNSVVNSPNQHTIKRSISCRGIGLHSGSSVSLSLNPAEPNTGIVFIYNRPGYKSEKIKALYVNVANTQLSTNLGKDGKTVISTVEHLMAAFHGCGIDNLIVEIDGPEVPIMDGSANSFVSLIQYAGLETQLEKRQIIKINKPISISDKNSLIRLEPNENDTLELNFLIEYEDSLIKKQRYCFNLHNDDFRDHICDARTYGFEHEVNKLREAGFAKGGSLENAVVVSGDKVLNADGLRYQDEFVRHKILDLLGDLFLSGHRISAKIYAEKSGHSLNNQLLHKLFAHRECWTLQEKSIQDDNDWAPDQLVALA